MKLLLDCSGDPNSLVYKRYLSHHRHTCRKTALLAAIGTGNIATVELLLNYGAEISCPAKLGLLATPLQYAALTGHLEIVQLLLDRGADVNERPSDRRGATALQFAAMYGYLAVVLRLLDYGADVNAPRPNGRCGRTAFEY